MFEAYINILGMGGARDSPLCINKYIKGLKANIQVKLLVRAPTTLQEAVQRATEAEREEDVRAYVQQSSGSVMTMEDVDQDGEQGYPVQQMKKFPRRNTHAQRERGISRSPL